ncbi:cytochrome c oxidase subunit 6C-like [Brevipalpus obovatus]|uniref:cytochrome c oxidase subunit 6C-like n=1 Tax=Brevipalpus obovatus TaxID=246614 RepID=UPI003D9F74FD
MMSSRVAVARRFITFSRMSSTVATSSRGAVKKLEKPELRRFHRYFAQNCFLISISVGLAAAALFKYTVALPRKRRYEEWVKNYDDEARTKYLLEHGVIIPDEYGIPE